MIYLDYCASAPQRPEVTQLMCRLMGALPGNPGAVHQAGGAARRSLLESRKALAALLQAQPQQIFFTSGGTESNNWAVKTGCRPGRRILAGATEHASVLRSVQAMQRQGRAVTWLQPDENGLFSPDAVARAITPDTDLLCIQAANNETGVIQDVAALAEAAHSRGVRFHCDAVQSFGRAVLPLEQADTVALSAHKLGGPGGMGCLMIRTSRLPEPLIHGGGQELGLRSGTENVIGAAGFALAATLSRQAASLHRLQELDALLLQLLGQKIPDMILNGGAAPRLPGVFSCRFPGMSAEELVMRLDLKGICISAGAACAAWENTPSHVLLAMGLTPEQAGHSVRISLGSATTEQELHLAVDAIAATLRR